MRGYLREPQIQGALRLEEKRQEKGKYHQKRELRPLCHQREAVVPVPGSPGLGNLRVYGSEEVAHELLGDVLNLQRDPARSVQSNPEEDVHQNRDALGIKHIRA